MTTARTKIMKNTSSEELIYWIDNLILVRLALKQASSLRGETMCMSMDNDILIYDTLGFVKLGYALNAEFTYESQESEATDLNGELSFMYRGFKVLTYTYPDDNIEELLKNE